MKTKRFKTKVNVLENKAVYLKTQNNNVDQHSRRNNDEILGIALSVSDSQLEEKVVDVLKAIDVIITTSEIEAC